MNGRRCSTNQRKEGAARRPNCLFCLRDQSCMKLRQTDQQARLNREDLTLLLIIE